MLTFIDISNWQRGIDLRSVLPNVDACVMKATEGLSFVDKCCDGFVSRCLLEGKPFGFYHYARNNDAVQEAEYFVDNTLGYFNKGIPILDWEENQSVNWVNAFVRRVHDKTGIWPWIYANPWRFMQGGVEPNCMRWVASYPLVTHPTFEQAKGWDCPSCDQFVGAWQFCSDGRVSGYDGNLDCNLFYGTKEAWNKYAGIDASSGGESGGGPGSSGSGYATVIENEKYKVTIEEK